MVYGGVLLNPGKKKSGKKVRQQIRRRRKNSQIPKKKWEKKSGEVLFSYRAGNTPIHLHLTLNVRCEFLLNPSFKNNEFVRAAGSVGFGSVWVYSRFPAIVFFSNFRTRCFF